MTPAKRPSTRTRQTPIQSLDDLQPDPLNANRGTDRGREALRRSLHTYGAGRSIVIDKRGRILGGHKTVEQAKHLGLPITVVPTTGQELVVVQRVDLDARTDPRAQELALADNRVAELDLDWDPAVLRQLEQAGVALEAFWTPEEFARLLAPEGPEAQLDENTVLAPPTTTTIRRGDVFQLGRHRLACGDATSATDVARLLAGATPCLMVTDPPYGVNYQPAFRHTAYPRQRTAVGRVTNDTQADWAAAYALFPGDVAYVWHAALFADVVMAGLRQAQFEVRSQIIWAKPTFVLGRGAYHWQHEPVWFAVRQGRAAPWYGGRTQSTVWEVPNLSAIGGSRTGANTPTGHATQKPVRVFEIPILNHTTVDDPVIDMIAHAYVKEQAQMVDLARSQLGTIGSSNHYVDLFRDGTGYVWVGRALWVSRGSDTRRRLDFSRWLRGSAGARRPVRAAWRARHRLLTCLAHSGRTTSRPCNSPDSTPMPVATGW